MKTFRVYFRSCFGSLDCEVVQARNEEDLFNIYDDRIVSFELIS